MKNIVAELTANNQLILRYVDRSNCLPSKNGGDSDAQKTTSRIAWVQQRLEDISKIFTHGCKPYRHVNLVTESTQLNLFNENLQPCGLDRSLTEAKIYAEACPLDIPLQYTDVQDGKGVTVNTTYHELRTERVALLDIIKKSQQLKRHSNCWGREQTPKRFTRNAKQRILEAGAIVDKYVDKENTFELTLTIPGSGYKVYDVVARWSGYIINRMTQVLRRLEKDGCEVYWFFVWEHQKRGALHQHWCIASPEGSVLVRNLCRMLRTKWFELLVELGEKEGVDLFQRPGYSGTWRHSPDKWQFSLNPLRKSVAAYFSKYCSKNVETERFNRERKKYLEQRREKGDAGTHEPRLLSLCPSRYWGSGYRIKSLCKQHRTVVSFSVVSRAEGDWVCEALLKWSRQISHEVGSVFRSFIKTCPKTGFIYCQGWERRYWFEADSFDALETGLKRIKNLPDRKTDAIGALILLMDF